MSDSDDWNLGFLAALEPLPSSAARRLSAIGLAVAVKSAAWKQGFTYGQALVAVRLSRSQAKRVPGPLDTRHGAAPASTAEHLGAAMLQQSASTHLH
jgi:hypothetical protein